ncbi:MAG TPA: pyruvate carboxylase [Thermodesulfobacteriota bacterium]|nr:pyruvate carboxylase [Thermodesulfobacteriota bacterium]
MSRQRPKKRIIKPFRRVMAANRGEIAIRVFRACTELGITTVAIYSEEDAFSLHRNKADEAYLIGKDKGPVEAYLDINGIIRLAKDKNVDAIHPGYGFLSENSQFAKACIEAGIAFIGPSPDSISLMGDKAEARRLAASLGIPIVPGTEGFINRDEEAIEFAEAHGYPILLKAAHGGGGRGIRPVFDRKSLLENLAQARSEARAAFGSDAIILEKYVQNPKHIEVQVLGDQYGNVVHLFERDCSVQRRHQKVAELAPAITLDPKLKEKMYEAALSIARAVNYTSAGTVEFLVDKEGNFYFIEMNTRIQVEHTVTEVITGIDLVQSQIRIAEGYKLSDPEIGISKASPVRSRGIALQCRITTEDPANNFRPDIGRLIAYRSPGGFGIRLDAASAYTGAVITPYYDSMLVKVTSWGLTFEQCISKMDRALQEFRIRGVKTNIPFLLNVIRHPVFRRGECATTFLEEHPEIFEIQEPRDRATRILNFIGDVTVNRAMPKPASWAERPPLTPRVPEIDGIPVEIPEHRRVFEKEGPEGLAKWVLKQKRLLITDTTFRDAHQSLLTTRMRTFNLLKIARATAYFGRNFFSYEMWGGATFDVCLRFLKECPWERLARLRAAMPHAMFQMLIRGANAVGYANYPDNVVREFIKEAASSGIDIFRIFDCFNWIPNMKVAIETAMDTGKVVEPAICYTGDITDPRRDKYTLNYYVGLAKELASMGAHFIAIKDMAGLCKPYAALKLVKAIKEETGLPLHFHTHATSGNGEATVLKASEAGADVVDLAISTMSGQTSQPSLNAVVAALEGTERDTGIDVEGLHKLSAYWEAVREYYAPFEGDMKTSNADVYLYEIPGGQYTNLRAQASALGLGDKWEEIKRMFAEVNKLFGDIIKVTPSSKVVGDLALFLVQNKLTTEDVVKKADQLSFPESVVDMMRGNLGQTPGGFPPEVQRAILKGEKPIEVRPGELIPPADFDETAKRLEKQLGHPISEKDLISALLYPGVFEEFDRHRTLYGDTSVVPTTVFFYGMEPGDETSIEIEEGKTLLVKLFAVGELESDGRRPLLFELNGQPRPVRIPDKAAAAKVIEGRPKADTSNPDEVGAPLSGKIVKFFIREGDEVHREQPLFVIEAMKMQTNIKAPKDGVVQKILVSEGDGIDAGDLILRLNSQG